MIQIISASPASAPKLTYNIFNPILFNILNLNETTQRSENIRVRFLLNMTLSNAGTPSKTQELPGGQRWTAQTAITSRLGDAK